MTNMHALVAENVETESREGPSAFALAQEAEDDEWLEQRDKAVDGGQCDRGWHFTKGCFGSHSHKDFKDCPKVLSRSRSCAFA